MLNKYRIEGDCVFLMIKKKNGRELEFVIDLADLPILQKINKSWCANWSETSKTWYVYHKDCSLEYQAVLLHRLLMNTPDHLTVNHEDFDGLNNRRRNLSNVTRTVNQLHHRMQSNNTSGYRGVVWDKSRGLYQARVKVEGKNRMIGRFKEKERANEEIVRYRINVLGCLA